MLNEYDQFFSSPSSVIHIPPWSSSDVDPGLGSPAGSSTDAYYAAAALRSYLPSNNNNDEKDLEDYLYNNEEDEDNDNNEEEDYLSLDSYSCDQFRMYDFKVRPCVRAKSHDWTMCPYAHPGEKARRRDSRKYIYSCSTCTDFRKGSCRKGDACDLAHGVFECWLHPNRYRTQPCKDGVNCRRRVCFFAHTPDQLRVVTTESYSPRSAPGVESYDGSPLRTSSVNQLVVSLRLLQLNKVKSYKLPPVGVGSPGLGSPRGSGSSPLGFLSLPNTPTGLLTRTRAVRYLDMWESQVEEEPVLERVESGRSLRAMMFEKLRSENSLLLDRAYCSSTTRSDDVDVGWVSELLQ